MRQLATIQTIADVQPIVGADSIEKVQVKGWWCVAKKGEFKVGDPCVYFEIDSLLPTTNPAFSFLEKGNKVKTVNVEGKGREVDVKVGGGETYEEAVANLWFALNNK